MGFKPDLDFLQCFDTVGLAIWPVKMIPEMTYNVLSGTLSLYITTTQPVENHRLVHNYKFFNNRSMSSN